MGPPLNARSLANRPLSDADQPFKERHVQGPIPLDFGAYSRRIMFADPAGDATKAKRGDPDWCACVVVGLRPDGKWEVCLADRMRGAPSQQAEFIARCAVRCKPQRLYQEAVKDEALIEVVRKALQQHGVGLIPEPVKPQTRKEVRIRDALEPHLEAGQLLVCGERFTDLREEMRSFPAGGHDDLLDALAAAYEKAAGSGVMRHRTGDNPQPEERPIRRRHVWDRGLFGAGPTRGIWDG